MTLSRLNTSFHSHNPQASPKRTLSFTSRACVGVTSYPLKDCARLNEFSHFGWLLVGRPDFFPGFHFVYRLCSTALSDFTCHSFCLSLLWFVLLSNLLPLSIFFFFLACAVEPSGTKSTRSLPLYFLSFLSFMLLTNLNLPLFTPLFVCADSLSCLSAHYLLYFRVCFLPFFLPPLVNFYTLHASVRCLPISTFPYLSPLLLLLLCYFPLALLNQLLFCSLLEFPLHLGNRAFPLFLPPSLPLRFLYSFSPL